MKEKSAWMITVASQALPSGAITIRRKRGAGTFVYEQGECAQSEADQYGVSLSPYIHALFGLLYQKQCARVLMIGCGGGTLASLLARIGMSVTVVDTNPAAFDFAARFFHLPSDVRCVVADGAAYLSDVDEDFDAVVLDAYNGSLIPEHLTGHAFLQSTRRRLAKTGVFLANVYVHHAFDFTADRFAATASAHWPVVRLLDASLHTCRNAIVMAGAVADLVPPSLLIYPEVGWTEVIEELGLLSFRPSRR